MRLHSLRYTFVLHNMLYLSALTLPILHSINAGLLLTLRALASARAHHGPMSCLPDYGSGVGSLPAQKGCKPGSIEPCKHAGCAQCLAFMEVTLDDVPPGIAQMLASGRLSLLLHAVSGYVGVSSPRGLANQSAVQHLARVMHPNTGLQMLHLMDNTALGYHLELQTSLHASFQNYQRVTPVLSICAHMHKQTPSQWPF